MGHVLRSQILVPLLQEQFVQRSVINWILSWKTLSVIMHLPEINKGEGCSKTFAADQISVSNDGIEIRIS